MDDVENMKRLREVLTERIQQALQEVDMQVRLPGAHLAAVVAHAVSTPALLLRLIPSE